MFNILPQIRVGLSGTEAGVTRLSGRIDWLEVWRLKFAPHPLIGRIKEKNIEATYPLPPSPII